MCWLNDPDIFVSWDLFTLYTCLLRTERAFKFLQVFWDAIAFWNKIKFLVAELLLHPIKIDSESVFEGEFSGHKELVYFLVLL